VVTPVYEQAYQESRNQFGYIGTRLTAHYYFWQKPRSRFHFLASAGFHYLVTADIQQQINGEWVSLSDANLNRENFSIAIGAGYNLTWNKGWELMISPVLTSYTQKVKNQSLPFTMDQQLMGLTIMLSKTLNPAK
nr:hypothetical protein [Cyclobacteriaceae bacterium]